MDSRISLDPVAAGVCTLLTSYLRLSAGNRLLVRVTSKEGGESRIPPQLRQVALELGIALTVEVLADNAPFDGAELPAFDALLYAGINKSKHRNELKEALKDGLETPCYRLFDLSPEVFALCFNMQQSHMAELNLKIIEAARSAKIIKIRSRNGTDLSIRPDAQADWTSSYGWFDGTYPGVLPPGEVNSYSEAIDGTLVVDGAINTNFAFDADPCLHGPQVRLHIGNGRVMGIESSNATVMAICETLFSMENGNRIGEIGFGTNEGIGQLVDFRSHINERLAGFHIGVGSPIQKNPYITWTCPLHIDFILASASIWFDDRLVFSNQRWIRTALPADTHGVVPDLYADTV